MRGSGRVKRLFFRHVFRTVKTLRQAEARRVGDDPGMAGHLHLVLAGGVNHKMCQNRE